MYNLSRSLSSTNTYHGAYWDIIRDHDQTRSNACRQKSTNNGVGSWSGDVTTFETQSWLLESQNMDYSD